MSKVIGTEIVPSEAICAGLSVYLSSLNETEKMKILLGIEEGMDKLDVYRKTHSLEILNTIDPEKTYITGHNVALTEHTIEEVSSIVLNENRRVNNTPQDPISDYGAPSYHEEAIGDEGQILLGGDTNTEPYIDTPGAIADAGMVAEEIDIGIAEEDDDTDCIVSLHTQSTIADMTQPELNKEDLLKKLEPAKQFLLITDFSAENESYIMDHLKNEFEIEATPIELKSWYDMQDISLYVSKAKHES